MDKLGKYIGKCFTFFRFLDLIVECAIGAFSDPFFNKVGQQPLIMAEMMCLLLERMELSTGFMQIEKKMHRTHTSKQTLLPSRASVKQIQAAKDMLLQEQLNNAEELNLACGTENLSIEN